MATFKEVVSKVVWSRWWVYALAIVTMVTSLTLLVCMQVKGNNVNVNDITLYPLERPGLPMPITVHVSGDFSEPQVKALRSGARMWIDATKGLARITIDDNWDQPAPFDPDFYRFYSDPSVWLKRSTDPNVVGLIIKHGFFDGVCKDRMIVVLDDGNLSDDKLTIIFAHELGHMMGLEHLRDTYTGLMSPHAGDWTITQYDLMQFCTRYECK